MEREKDNISYPLVALKGVAMGAADVIPGVSGGTIAFISGIYERLLRSIRSIDLRALKLLFTLRLREFWAKIDGGFLLSLLVGIAVSVFSLARVMKWLLENEPVGTWSFFFGLIVASALLVGRTVTRWSAGPVVALICGTAAAWAITVISPASTPDTWWFVILSGAVAICAMILPGISGAFVLLLMGKYHYIMAAVSSFDLPVLLLFASGAVVGLVLFSHLLTWLLRGWHNITVGVLTGFMVGALNKIWPWKETLQTYLDSSGVSHPLVERNVLPSAYAELHGGADPQLLQAVICGAAGFLLIFTIEYFGKLASRRRSAGGEKRV